MHSVAIGAADLNQIHNFFSFSSSTDRTNWLARRRRLAAAVAAASVAAVAEAEAEAAAQASGSLCRSFFLPRTANNERCTSPVIIVINIIYYITYIHIPSPLLYQHYTHTHTHKSTLIYIHTYIYIDIYIYIYTHLYH